MHEIWQAEQIFDGQTLHSGAALVTKDSRFVDLCDAGATIDGAVVHDLGPGVLCPGFLDLQVNGGGGVLLGQGDPFEAICTICATHGRLGSLGVMPTLITSDAPTMHAVLAAARRAVAEGVPGFQGLHLEGPFLDPARKGAHDADLIRPMTEGDLLALVAVAQDLPALMVTVAPKNASHDQIGALAAAGVVVSLGHTDATDAQARAAISAGATCVTHLYNAMSPLHHRAPGLVGAALDTPVWSGIIPDGIHVAATAFRIAVQAKPGKIFAVSDAMAVAGTDIATFTLNGRQIRRQDGQLTLSDGTLAGADITLPQAVRWMVERAGIALEQALAMVTSIPAQVIDRPEMGRFVPGAPADLVHLDNAFEVQGVWRSGVPVL